MTRVTPSVQEILALWQKLHPRCRKYWRYHDSDTPYARFAISLNSSRDMRFYLAA